MNQSEKDDLVTPIVSELKPVIKELRLKKTEQSEVNQEKGLNFNETLAILNKVDFFGTFELTDKERMSVLSTQIVKEILLSINMI